MLGRNPDRTVVMANYVFMYVLKIINKSFNNKSNACLHDQRINKNITTTSV